MNLFTLNKNKVFKIIQVILFFPFILIFLILAPIFKFKILEIETRAIGHMSRSIEIFLCEVYNKLHSPRNIYLSFTNNKIANKFLLKKYKKYFIFIPNIIAYPIFNFLMHKHIYPKFGNKYLSGYRHWTKATLSKPHQEIDIYNVLPITTPRIDFSKEEKVVGEHNLERLGIKKKQSFICLHLRKPFYYTKNNIIDKFQYNLRDHRYDNYFKSIDYLSSLNKKVIFMGENYKISKKHANISYYNQSDLRSDFMDIFLSFNCSYMISNPSGICTIPSMNRIKCLYLSASEIHGIRSMNSIYIPFILPKKFKLIKNNELIPYSYVIKKKLSEIIFLDDLNKLGYDIEENTEEEILDSIIEMEHFLNFRKHLNHDQLLLEKYLKTFFHENKKNVFSIFPFSFMKKYPDIIT